VVSFTSQPRYPRYPLDRRLGGPHSQSGENSWPYLDSNTDPSVGQPVASRYTDHAIPAPHFDPDTTEYYFHIYYVTQFHVPKLNGDVAFIVVYLTTLSV
jgi:hypothetical protein